MNLLTFKFKQNQLLKPVRHLFFTSLQKREKRATSNWTLLVKGLLIRERLKQRYGKKNQGLSSLAQGEETGGLSSDEEVVKGGSPEAKTASETLAMSWPQNRQAEEDGGGVSGLKKKTTTKREKKGQEKHLFPFEKAWCRRSRTTLRLITLCSQKSTWLTAPDICSGRCSYTIKVGWSVSRSEQIWNRFLQVWSTLIPFSVTLLAGEEDWK